MLRSAAGNLWKRPKNDGKNRGFVHNTAVSRVYWVRLRGCVCYGSEITLMGLGEISRSFVVYALRHRSAIQLVLLFVPSQPSTQKNHNFRRVSRLSRVILVVPKLGR